MSTSLTVPADQSLLGIWGPVINANWNSLNNWFYTGAIRDASLFADVQAAIDDLPADGGVVDARSPLVNLALGTIDPGTRVVTLLLGPYVYTATQIKLRDSFKILGAGNGGNSKQTVIQSDTATTDLIVLTGSVPVTGVEIGWLRLYGQAGAGGSTAQSALSFIAQVDGGGCWWSKFHHLTILGFKGLTSTKGIIRLDGTAGGTPPGINQFLLFEQVECYRPSGGPDLEVLGFNGQIHFINSHLDSNSGVITGTNITIKDTSASLFPFSLTFDDVTVQSGDTHIEISGGNRLLFSNMHHESAATQAYLVSASAGANTMVTIRDSQFNADIVSQIVNITAAATTAAVIFTGNNYGAVAAIAGTTAAFKQWGNTGGTSVTPGTLWDSVNSL